jgi:hypothetical protein
MWKANGIGRCLPRLIPKNPKVTKALKNTHEQIPSACAVDMCAPTYLQHSPDGRVWDAEVHTRGMKA